MIGILTILFFSTVILCIALVSAKEEVSQLKAVLKDINDIQHKAINTAIITSDNLITRKIALYWTFRKTTLSETVICVERDPTGNSPDTITHRYERELDDQGRCISESHYTQSGLIQRSIYDYGTLNAKEPTHISHYDGEGKKEVWADVLQDDKGRPLAYLRYRECNNLRDIGLYEYDDLGRLAKSYEAGYLDWPYTLSDIPGRFHQCIPNDKCRTINYEYPASSSGKTLSQAIRATQGNVIQNFLYQENSIRQISELESGNVNSVTHYIPSEHSPALSIVVGHGAEPITIHINLTIDHVKELQNMRNQTNILHSS